MSLELMKDEPSAERVESTDSLFPEGAIRLAEISVYNWGTFNGLHTGRIDPGGTLISGHTGAGKSTFADALQPLLLLPKNSKFNVAASQSEGGKDRDLFTYVRGRLGSLEDSNGRTMGRFLRSGDTLSGIRALYRTDRGNEITLAALFWIAADGTSSGDVQRGYVVAHCNITLKEMLDALRGRERGISWDQLSNQYKGRRDVHCTRKFEAYAEWYREALWLQDPKAPALLARAMGLKRIENLTSMVRELVLEEPDTRERGLKAITEFNSLNAIHEELVTVRKRRDKLDRVPVEAAARTKEILLRDDLQRQYNVLPAWHSAQVVVLLNEAIREKQLELAQLEQRKRDAKAAIDSAQGEHADAIQIYKAAGGDNLDQLKANLVRANSSLQDATTNQDTLAKVLEKVGLKPPADGWTEAALSELKSSVLEHVAGTAAQLEKLREEMSRLIIAESKTRDQIAEIVDDLKELGDKPDSNIEGGYLKLRKLMCETTGIPISEIPFVGELIDVKESEKAWRGAIERALGFRRLRFVVPEQHEAKVRSFLDSRNLGMRVGVDVTHPTTGMVEFKPQSFLRKLEWSKGPHREWVKRYLLEASLDCVESADAMKGHPYCMTITGLIQYKIGTYEKDDSYDINNPRKWHIGFSNEPRKAMLHSELQVQLKLQGELKEQIKANELQSQDRRSFETQGQRALEFEWSSIDVVGALGRVRELEGLIVQMEDRSVDLAAARQRVRDTKEMLDAAFEASNQIVGMFTAATTRLADYESDLAKQKGRASTILDPSLPEKLATRFKLLTMDDLPREAEIERTYADSLRTDLNRSNSALNGHDRSLGEIMTAYKEAFPGEAADLPLRSRYDQETAAFTVIVNEWVTHYNDLVNGRLPELVERFQKSLNLQTTQSLTAIYQSIQTQKEQILERIEQINSVLERTEIKNGSHMSLVSIPLVLESAKAFDDQLKLAMSRAAGSDSEAHFKSLQALIRMLERATDPSTRHNKDTECQLDARFRMSFAIREWRPPQGKGPLCPIDERVEVDTHRDTKGKSGGEKEGFSGLVVASALAYVLSPKGAHRPSYCSVMLDEAFSNTSDDLAKRVLKVFRELGLHLNLITPFKNVELARSAVQSAVVVEIDTDSHSHLSEVTWQEIDRQRLAAEMEDDVEVRAAADRLNISFEPVATRLQNASA